MKKEILFEWNPWWTKGYKFEGITRDILTNLIPWIKRKEIISITGVRRAGKTTLMYETIDYLIKKKINPKNILFIKADDDRVETEELIDESFKEYQRWINPQSKIFIFIDEIQEIKKWQKTLKRIYDSNSDIKIFVSGSNASILKEDLSTLLAGRTAYFEVFPFSFLEFLKSRKIIIKNEFDCIKHKNEIKHLLTKFVENGSFPEVALEKDEKLKKELVRYYFDSIFYRDIIKKRKIRNPEKLEKLIKYYLQNVSNLANFTKISKPLELTTDSVGEYTKYLGDAYLIFHINLFEFSYKKQIINPKKIYCVDTGIRNIIGFNFSEDVGRLYENIVFIGLRKKFNEIFYWRNKNECDFIVKDGKKLTAIQVCYDIKKIKERELKGLLEAIDNFKLKKGLIITDDFEAEEIIDNKKIKYLPLWKWLILSEL
ncbi:MAG: ATP-binding protein [Alphaproteobacteria bacterium]